jgi:hypothetical protein
VSDNSNKPDNTLPRPELNPLLNPVLGSHMGRWAEVYFTTAPEKREEAVEELLQELQGTTPASPIPPENVETPQEKPRDDENRNLVPQALETYVNCSACGHLNLTEHKFCGMCGALLQVTIDSVRDALHMAASASAGSVSTAGYAPQRQRASEFPEARLSSETGIPGPRFDFEDTLSAASYDLPGFQTQRETHPKRPRLYLGVVLVALLTVLAYWMWHGAGESSSAVHTTPPPAAQPSAMQPSPTQPAVTPGTAATPAPTEQANRAPSAPPQNVSASSDSAPATTAPPVRESRRRAANVAAAALPPTFSAVNGPGTPLTPGDGSEELAVAQKYLDGTMRGGRDSSEAAKWLWKAVSKQNGAATLVLSDLYLRGDGVLHSCDQARLLLDAAARKGKPEAAERLRNLQAFGCQ